SFCTDSSRTSNRVLDDRSQTYTRRHLVALGPPWENDLYVLGDHAFDLARQPSVLCSFLGLHCASPAVFTFLLHSQIEERGRVRHRRITVAAADAASTAWECVPQYAMNYVARRLSCEPWIFGARTDETL